MSKCELTIELDKDSYRPGETITGKVHVCVNEDMRCDGLEVRLEWYTHGRGNREDEVVASQELAKGQWTPGRSAYPFQLTSPKKNRDLPQPLPQC